MVSDPITPLSRTPNSTTRRQNLSSSSFNHNMGNDALEIKPILTDEDGLNNEISLRLIGDLKVHSPTTTPPLRDKEVFDLGKSFDFR